MELEKPEANLLYYIIEGMWSYDETVKWAYSKYTDEGACPWIERITLADDTTEILQILSETFGVNGNVSIELELGAFTYECFSLKDRSLVLNYQMTIWCFLTKLVMSFGSERVCLALLLMTMIR